ncbi:hypothetical protein J6W20_04560 [bacterium]|nr:hypothetical protein [bacterium]
MFKKVTSGKIVVMGRKT